MKPAAFAYHRPASLAALFDLLDGLGDDAKVIAGGQSLVAAMNFRLARPDALVDLNAVGELDYLRRDEAVLRIGALTRHAAFHRPVIEGALGALLAQVVRHIAHYPIRQRGTFAGSIAHADPASEWCLVATVLGAEIVARSRSGERIVPAETFFQGMLATDLRPDEIVVEVRLPLLDAGWRWGFNEFSRRAGDFALAMALATLRIEDGAIVAAGIGVGGVADRPVRLAQVEASLIGCRPEDVAVDPLARMAADTVEPGEDFHASGEYRRDLVAATLARALRDAIADGALTARSPP